MVKLGSFGIIQKQRTELVRDGLLGGDAMWTCKQLLDVQRNVTEVCSGKVQSL